MEQNNAIRYSAGDLCTYITKDKNGETVRRTGEIIMVGDLVCRVLPSGCRKAILVPTSNIL